MKKTLLAIAIPALIFANATSAVELYNDDVNTFAIGGHIAVGLTGSEEGETKVESLSPRLNVEVSRDLGEGFKLDLRSEWWVNILEGGAESFSTRLGYVGLTHDAYGRAVIGTQWSPYYSVAGIAERTVSYGNGFLYNNHYNLGTARAEGMVSYSNTADLGDAGAVKFGLGWQAKHTESNTDDYDTRMQAALTYQIMDFSVGYAYNSGDVTYASVGSTQEAVSNVVSAKYGAYGTGLYVAAVYAENEYMFNALEETVQMEAIVAYALANSLNFSVNYEAVDDDKANDTVYSELAFNVEYNFLDNVKGYVGYQVDLGSDGIYDAAEDNKWALGVRVFL
ncbi:MAG: putative porin [Psychromonas sp.]|jgi:predicted porin|uniref:porin n=1 Tax=Psychromonas sp. TaxID=1884585 RepID=UPI0039E547D2